MAKVIIPTPLRKYTENQSTIEANGSTVGEALRELVQTYPELQQQLQNGSGQLRSYINIFVGEESIQSLNKEETAVDKDTIISIVPAIAGGIGATIM